jgi:hypothetical protein
MREELSGKKFRLWWFLLGATWLLSLPGIGAGVYVLAMWWWEQGKHDFSWTTQQGHTAFGLVVWLFIIWSAGLITAFPATFCMFFLWGSERAPTRQKIGATIAVAVSWLGLSVLWYLQNRI